jgi:hypothetical protein
MKMRLVLFVMIALLLLSASSFAGTIVSLKELGSTPGDQVQIYVSTYFPAPNGVVADVGLYWIDIQDVGQYPAWCVDPAYSTFEYTDYELNPVIPGTVYAGAAYLLNKYAYDPNVTDEQHVLMQLAVWDTVWSSHGNTFSVAPVPAYDYSAYKAEILANENFLGDRFYLASSPVGSPSYGVEPQDFLLHVPEPGSMLLLGLGLAWVGLAGKKIV